MDKKLKTKWVKALRSGKYKQAHGQLRDKDAYCCLGVLCHVHGIPINIDGRGVEGLHGEITYRPIWQLVGESEGRTLASMNDGNAPYWRDNPQPFSKIADYIEKHF